MQSVKDHSCLLGKGVIINTDKCPYCMMPLIPEIGAYFRSTNSSGQCSICLQNFQNDSIIVSCNHIFHYFCISDWLSKKRSCPECRNPL